MKGINETSFYNTIARPSSAEYKDRGSKFIAYAFPVVSTSECKKWVQDLKKEHPKAAHHCFAFRTGTEGNSFRASDDGEPPGSAGRPILGQIDSKQLTNILVIVVRYFGGTLLGVPGLINAYKTVASLALQVTPIVQKQVEIKYSIEFDYTLMNDVMMLMKQFNCTVISNETRLFCRLTAGIPVNRMTEVLYRLNELPNVTTEKCK